MVIPTKRISWCARSVQERSEGISVWYTLGRDGLMNSRWSRGRHGRVRHVDSELYPRLNLGHKFRTFESQPRCGRQATTARGRLPPVSWQDPKSSLARFLGK